MICWIPKAESSSNSSEDDWLRHLYDGPIDGIQLFSYSCDLIFRDAALSKSSQCEVQIQEFLGTAEGDPLVAVNASVWRSFLQFLDRSCSLFCVPDWPNA